MMGNRFEQVMFNKSDKELFKIVTGAPDDYQPEGFEAAKMEFAKRNLSADLLERLAEEIAQDQLENENKADEPLWIGWKVFKFIFPGLFQLFFGMTFKSDGYDRKAKEFLSWTIYGYCFYLGLAAVIIILNMIL